MNCNISICNKISQILYGKSQIYLLGDADEITKVKERMASIQRKEFIRWPFKTHSLVADCCPPATEFTRLWSVD